jgi:hypothetical protein
MFFSETSTAKPIETLLYLINLYARKLASQLDVPYQPEARPPSSLTNNSDSCNIYLQDSTTYSLFHPCLQLPPLSAVVMPSTPTPDPSMTLLSTRLPLPGCRLLPSITSISDAPLSISVDVLPPNMYMPQASTLPSSAPALLSPTSKLTMSGTSAPDAKWLPGSFILSSEPASPGGLVEIRTGSPLPGVPDEAPEDDTIHKLISAGFMQLTSGGYLPDIPRKVHMPGRLGQS